MKEDTFGYISDDIILGIGEKTKIKFGFMDSITLIYSGMPSKDVFSIALLFGSGYQGYSYNLYYPKDSKTIKIGAVSLSIVSVQEDTLTVRK